MRDKFIFLAVILLVFSFISAVNAEPVTNTIDNITNKTNEALTNASNITNQTADEVKQTLDPI